MKVSMDADSASLQPGSFDTDYATAAAVPPSAGGPAQIMQRLTQTGIAQRHYLFGSKERVDDVVRQSATIVDCAARTTTTLDLRGKTYQVTSMDEQAGPDSGAGGGAPSHFLGNGARIAASITNTALGTLVVGGQSADGFRSNIISTVTSASGESHTAKAVRVAYYSAYNKAAPPCPAAIFADAVGPGIVSGLEQLMNAILSGGMNLHVSVNENGPLPPRDKLALYEGMTFGMQGHGAAIVIERGNVRSIAADDPIFSIPPGFTKQQ